MTANTSAAAYHLSGTSADAWEPFMVETVTLRPGDIA